MSATERFHEVANDALVNISEHLWPDAKLALVVYEPGKPTLDIVLKDKGIDLDEVLNTLRRAGLSIDGDNAYKRDLCDSIVGSMAFGAQDRCPPPTGHWAQRFWDIGRESSANTAELVSALDLVSGCLMDALAGRDLPAAKVGRAIATTAELLAKQSV
ncbi:hypothetical protein ACQR3P_18330 [Rhodococcus sp. IEGM1300]